jgi:Ca2+/H+ antiporter
MQKHIQIKSLFFLGIFSLLLLHQVVPHWHHQYEVEHTHKAVVDSNNHKHHHDTPKNENSNKGFLALFLDVHVHSVIVGEIVLRHLGNVKKHNVQKSVKIPFQLHEILIVNYSEIERDVVYQPPNYYFNSFLLSLTSRGPPTLG